MANFLSNAVGALLGKNNSSTPAYDPAAAAKAQSNYNANANNPYAVGQTSTGATVYNPTPTTPAYDPNGAIAAANAAATTAAQNLAAIQAQVAALPKLPAYDTTAAYASAQKAATAAVDPVYQDKLNQYLQQEQLTTAETTRKEGETEAGIATTLGQQTEDNATNRTRTGEDQTTKIGDVNTNEGNFQQDSGTAFDRARSALLGTVAGSGLTTSGIGQGQVAASTADRNQAEKEQTQTFDASRRDINTAATRTFADLATSDTRNTSAAATNTTQAKEGLQDYIDNANLDEQNFRTTNESDRQAAISGATQQEYSTGVNNFIASLIGSGARSQDVQLAKEIYG